MKDAKAIITESIAKLQKADAPDALRPRIAGEIDMAYKLGLIDYEERDAAMNNMLNECIRRREELHRAKLARLSLSNARIAEAMGEA